MNTLDKDFWTRRYETGETGWDAGKPTPILEQYIQQIASKDIAVLIPGCGRAWEADVILECGITNVTLADISEAPFDDVKKRLLAKKLPEPQLFIGDFFSLKGAFDLVLEQTFFCALSPELRSSYVRKMHEIIKPGGKLAGVVFSVEFPFDGPPFGAKPNVYLDLFSPYFEVKIFEPAYNSIQPRNGNEYFMLAIRK